MTENGDQMYWVAFSTIEGIGPQKFKLLTAAFPNLGDAWHADSAALRAARLPPHDVEAIVAARPIINPARCTEHLEQLGIRTVTWAEADYPALLKEIYGPPPVLYYQGTLPPSWGESLAVVGTRRTSTYGRQVTPTLVQELARAGLLVVSGLALGIDSLAHQAALDVGGTTAAVMACGLDLVYPRSNATLADRITGHGGCLLSEYPPGAEPLKQRFPARNRIIAGLTRGVLVIEGAADSGSLITARCAADENREVFAVPGNITCQTAAGPNRLISMGARIVSSSHDILETLNVQQLTGGEPPPPAPTTPEESQVLAVLTDEPMHVDEIIQHCTLNTSTTNATLSLMELSGMVRHLGGQLYVRAGSSRQTGTVHPQ
ncbi:MAG: DNA-processing protein DprA [Patescibacteria group bacterium]